MSIHGSHRWQDWPPGASELLRPSTLRPGRWSWVTLAPFELDASHPVGQRMAEKETTERTLCSSDPSPR